MNSTFSVVYKDRHEWEQVKDNLYESIFNGLLLCLNDDIEYNNMINVGITDNQRIYLMDLIEMELVKITNNKQWAENTTFNLIYGIQGFIQGFIKTNKWKILFNSLDAIELADILFENIKWQLDDDTHSPCLLEDVYKYRCSECNRITNFIYNNKCEDC